MKTSSVGIVLVLILFAISGCATTNPSRSQETVSSVEAVEEQLNQIMKQLDETQKSLENVTNTNDESDIEDAYNSYSDNVEALVDMKNELNNRVNKMKETSDEYLTQWQNDANTYNSGDLRRASEQRRNELSRTLDRVLENSGEVNRMLESFISDTREIESYLANDLTTNGADAVAESQRNVDRTEDEVKNAISRMQNSVTDIKQEMGSAGEIGSNE